MVYGIVRTNVGWDGSAVGAGVVGFGGLGFGLGSGSAITTIGSATVLVTPPTVTMMVPMCSATGSA